VPLIFLLLSAICFIQPQMAQAHGGIIIDSDFTDDYEWLMAVNPFPMTPGEVSLALLVYDVKTYDPINDLQVELYLAAPSSPKPCCNPEDHQGPIELEILPDIYPGDYSAFVDLQEVGEWEAQYIINAEGKESFELVVPFEIRAQDPNQPRPTLEYVDPTGYGPTALVDDEGPEGEVVATPTDIPVSFAGLQTLFAENLWLWGVVAIIPIGMIIMAIFLSPKDDQRDEDQWIEEEEVLEDE